MEHINGLIWRENLTHQLHLWKGDDSKRKTCFSRCTLVTSLLQLQPFSTLSDYLNSQSSNPLQNGFLLSSPTISFLLLLLFNLPFTPTLYHFFFFLHLSLWRKIQNPFMTDNPQRSRFEKESTFHKIINLFTATWDSLKFVEAKLACRGENYGGSNDRDVQ